MLRKIGLGLLAVIMIAQFIRPSKNKGVIHGPRAFSVTHQVTPAVERILARSCYDCHSNNTHYPWYANIQPLGWWLQHHVDEGKEALNFSEWTTYKKEDMPHIMEELGEEVEKGHMPLPDYLRIHTAAKLSEADKDTLVQWAMMMEAELQDRRTCPIITN